VTIEELAKEVDDLKNRLIALQVDVNQDRNRFSLAAQNFEINLKNLAFVMNTPFVSIAEPEPTNKRK